MVQGWGMVFVVLMPVLVASPAFGGGRGAVCREPSVVDEMTREIRDHSYYSEVDPKLITESPTADPALVRCQVCVQSAPYDMTWFGDRPVARCLPHDFEVRIVPAGCSRK